MKDTFAPEEETGSGTTRREAELEAEAAKKLRSVFISYSHHALGHREIVKDLSRRLRRDGFGVTADIDAQPLSQGWTQWVRTGLREAHAVLLLCSDVYRQDFEGLTAETAERTGVVLEGRLVAQALLRKNLRNEKFIPVLPDGELVSSVPDLVYDTPHFRYPSEYPALRNCLRNLISNGAPATGRKDTTAPEDDWPGRVRRWAGWGLAIGFVVTLSVWLAEAPPVLPAHQHLTLALVSAGAASLIAPLLAPRWRSQGTLAKLLGWAMQGLVTFVAVFGLWMSPLLPVKPIKTYTVKVSTRDSEGRPVSGVRITLPAISDRPITVTANRIDIPSVKLSWSRTAVINAEHGYVRAQPVTIKLQQELTQVKIVLPGCELSGSIVDEKTGDGIDEAYVNVLRPIVGQTTTKSGRFSLFLPVSKGQEVPLEVGKYRQYLSRNFIAKAGAENIFKMKPKRSKSP